MAVYLVIKLDKVAIDIFDDYVRHAAAATRVKLY